MCEQIQIGYVVSQYGQRRTSVPPLCQVLWSELVRVRTPSPPLHSLLRSDTPFHFLIVSCGLPVPPLYQSQIKWNEAKQSKAI
jgi:hypothetical protein